ncbi:MAG TPA: amidohydrolase family protein [Thermoplasmata archaeon]|nr:amidohydrolase family protein [Thermoplasmata archaeon]
MTGPIGGILAIRGARILPSPDAPPIDRGNVVIERSRIVGVGPDTPIPRSAEVISGEGRVVTAGFWNCHVHFTQEKWRRVHRKEPSLVEAQFHDMVTSRGFTTVVDTGSDPRVTLSLRSRVESEGLLGPKIYTAGSSIFPPKGIPYYLHDSLPLWIRPFVPTPRTPWAVRGIVRRGLDRGADLVKLFTGSYAERGFVRTMPEAVATAAVEAAHARGRLVFSHPSNLEGTRVAIRSGVDVLAHPPDTTAGVDETVVREMVDRKMAMIPTLKMFARSVSEDPTYLQPIYQVVRRFRELGGQLLFGTDVGYMTDYATDEEFRALADCGVEAREVLRSLTTAPAQRFGVADRVGTVTVGAQADLTVLDADPGEHPLAFTRVRATIRSGRVLHLRP